MEKNYIFLIQNLLKCELHPREYFFIEIDAHFQYPLKYELIILKEKKRKGEEITTTEGDEKPKKKVKTEKKE